MAVPPRPGTEFPPPSFEHEASPRVPRPLPDRSRRPSTPALMMVLAVLIVVALVVLL